MLALGTITQYYYLISILHILLYCGMDIDISVYICIIYIDYSSSRSTHIGETAEHGKNILASLMLQLESENDLIRDNNTTNIKIQKIGPHQREQHR